MKLLDVNPDKFENLLFAGSDNEKMGGVQTEPGVSVEVSVILHFCKSHLMYPYFRLLSLLGWRPLVTCSGELGCCAKLFNMLYVMVVVAFLWAGYLLQYSACFRQDSFSNSQILLERFHNTTREMRCPGNPLLVWVLPCLLHALAYFLTLFLLNSSQVEQLETLMERVFLNSTFTQTWQLSQKKLIRCLRLFLTVGLVWLLATLVQLLVRLLGLVLEDPPSPLCFSWLSHLGGPTLLTCILFVSLLLAEAVNAAIALSYCVYCQMLVFYLSILQRAVRERNMHFIDFVREVEQIRHFVSHLNDRQSLGISLVILCLTSQVFNGLEALMYEGLDNLTLNTATISSLLFLGLRAVLLALPFLQAARLSHHLSLLHHTGLELRCRPFGYQTAPQHELDSLLLYTQALDMKARLIQLPIRTSGLLCVLAAVVFGFLICGGWSLLPHS